MEDFLAHTSPADLLFGGLLLFGCIQGLLRGLSGEITRLLSLSAVVTGTLLAFRPAGAFLETNTRLEAPLAYGVGLGLVFFAALLTVRLAGLVVRSILEFTFKGPVERVGGALAGTLRVSLYLAVFLLSVNLSPIRFLQRHAVEDSRLGSVASDWLLPLYADQVRRHPDWPLPVPEPAPTDAPQGDKTAPPPEAPPS